MSSKHRLRKDLALARLAFVRWYEHRSLTMAAALAFYGLISLAPMLMVMVALAGMIFGEETVRGELVAMLQGSIGEPAARTVQTVLRTAMLEGVDSPPAILGLLTFAVGIAAFIHQLHESLNTVWGVEDRRIGSRFMDMLRRRALAPALVLASSLIIIIFFFLGAGVEFVRDTIQELAGVSILTVRAGQIGVTFVSSVLLFGLVYRLLPDVRIPWRSVAGGAVVTAVLFLFGQVLIGEYVRSAKVATVYGAAGSLVVI
ncbi:MAG: YihY/virulence factor BrkB family protein, partial [Gemmatimonadota bacterium]